jgi:hypothetical protein
LDKVCGSILQKTCQKYDNLSEVDKLASVTKKVDTVKLVMQENVELALKNVVKLETIERAAGENTHSYNRNVTEEASKLYLTCFLMRSNLRRFSLRTVKRNFRTRLVYLSATHMS